ncbi:MAG TPA: RIP metalloprotease RseP [Paenalcaligenes hominis]|uniref:Zinc metalloprotease n=1 Tax=Paenalcaligenes hominis TaxID=643674 RepID=A0A9D3AAC8_9BURK|nr:RIP metalloprotease RseP [Paenalcaligenes hominis]NJB64468.1 regulator of sigma E protease [Paenalcaligenes hominis]GGE67413.1 zinc metalloprotease [Paenalcaligenes hominis]HJH23059.1 RIP metalloprotease RseP [Paenalcaligenes hominis]
MVVTLLAFAVAIGVLMMVHELGHYLVARYYGVHVERFSLGIGKVLFKRTDKNGCEWAVSALPIGAYVMMRNQTSEHASEEYKATTFDAKTLGQRAAITVAGPLANLLLAAVLYALIGVVGTNEPAPLLGPPSANTPAAQAGVTAGDRVLAVNQTPIQSWSQLRWQLMDTVQTGGEVQLTVTDQFGTPAERYLQLVPSSLSPELDPLLATGLSLATPSPKIRDLVEGSAAAQAGLQANDLLIALNGQPIVNAAYFVEQIKSQANQTITLEVERQGQRLELPVQVASHEDRQGQVVGRIGIMLGADIEMVTVRYGPIASIQQGLSRTADTFWLSLKMVGRMITGDVSVKNISGPVSIADYAGQTARIGLSAYLHFLALISISIGLLNLLPIPMLDGGHLLYYAIEAVTGRPVSDGVKLIGQRIGLSLLAALTFLAFFNDFNRLLN